MSDVETERLSFQEFTSFVLYAPPGTAVFHVVNGGWTADTHQLTSVLDVQRFLLWSGSADAQSDFPQHKPEPWPRPMAVKAKPKPEFTVEDYMKMMEGESDV